jgi:hypothetical protein
MFLLEAEAVKSRHLRFESALTNVIFVAASKATGIENIPSPRYHPCRVRGW